jgi:hypothetical protein
LFDAFEIAAMNGRAAMASGVVITVSIVVRGVAVKETVGDDLINALSLPEQVGAAVRLWLNAEAYQTSRSNGHRTGGPLRQKTWNHLDCVSIFAGDCRKLKITVAFGTTVA